MRSIQDVGLEIMNKTPQKFYAFCGIEYGIKLRYINMLLDVYPNKVEADSVDAVLKLMETKHFVPLEPSVYIVRYDEDFIKQLTEKTVNRIAKVNVSGCIVCIYQDEKHAAKLDKYLSDYTVSIDKVNPNFMVKYLHKDYPHCPDRLINLAISIATDYNQASLICREMCCVEPEKLFAMSDSEIIKLFGGANVTDEQAIKVGIASRNYPYLISLIANYDQDLNNIMYTILSTLIELEKLQVSPYTQSIFSQYIKRWSRKDIYNLFMHTYQGLKALRSVTSNPENVVMYILSLLQFSEIPDVEVMS